MLQTLVTHRVLVYSGLGLPNQIFGIHCCNEIVTLNDFIYDIIMILLTNYFDVIPLPYVKLKIKS